MLFLIFTLVSVMKSRFCIFHELDLVCVYDKKKRFVAHLRLCMQYKPNLTMFS